MITIVRHHFRSLESTNTWAKQNLGILHKENLTLITADEQTAGRGRWKRSWVSPPFENIYATFCFFLPKHRDDIGNIPQILAMTAAHLLQKYGVSPKVKWPNDVMIQDKKCAGILCETAIEQDSLAVIVGIGLNVNMKEETLKTIDRPATSLYNEIRKTIDVDELTDALASSFQKDLLLFFEKGFAPFSNEYEKLFWLKPQQQVTLYHPPETYQGSFQTLLEDGSILVKLSTGQDKIFTAGEIVQ